MCTLTVIAGEDSHHVAMNRDEKIARGAGTPPEVREIHGTRAIYPGDGAGGTWIAANEYGMVLALLNWNDVPCGTATGGTQSRGRVIPALIASRSLPELQAVLLVSLLEGMLPFRLVGVFPSEKQILEWRWDAAKLDFQAHAWESRHWFSSSLSDTQAESLRGAACRNARSELDAGSLPWLRRLHASHAGGPGPFSLCVHREDVKTLSYTEVTCTPATVAFEHFLASPCSMCSSHLIETQRVVSLDSHHASHA